MRIRWTASQAAHSSALCELVPRRLQYALGRLARRIEEAAVSFTDLNGPRGGLDQQCRIRLLLRPRGEINVSATAASADSALSTAALRAARCLKSRVRRRWALRRRRRGHRETVSAARTSSWPVDTARTGT